MSAKILVIEDNEQNRYLITYLLETDGHNVTHVSDGPTAIERLGREEFDLVLLDIQLPKMDGYSVAKLMRTKPELVDVPIIAVTSYAMSGDREKAIAAGCNGYIEKPIDPATFGSEIGRYLTLRPTS